MSTQLTAEAPSCPAEYELRVEQVDSVIEVVVSRDGALAARGKAARTGEYAVIDQVITEPGHQRRGLGTTVMRALSQAASRGGARTGVLVATEQGQRLYDRLGWVLVSPMTAARLCAPECPELRADPPRG
ncbi:GNAT family N-acetyltransferase [Kribbella sp. NPDC051718]|uniref:GNAT family N-acetyltransferase n=1 Tax=Kribbella sp. NPDC051718 TaxID=3155168 RepID=UPI0034197F14